MKTITRVAITLAAAGLLSACNSSDDAERSQPPPIQETVFKDMAGAVDKAHEVEDVTKQRTEQLNKALEASESR